MRTPFIRERDGFQMLIIVLFLAFLAAAGGGVFLSLRTPRTPQPEPAGCTLEAKLCPDGSAVGRTGPNCEFAPCPPTDAPPKPEPVFCTQDAKLCPDGSYVGRVAPNCEFAPCPGLPRACSGEADTSCGPGYRCIQECGPPVAREDDPPPAWYCETEANAAKPRMCPICLAATTNIATPSGQVNVQKLMVGMKVWSLDAQGKKIVSTVVRVGRTPAPKTHRVIRLMLSDGREVRVSPNHPTASGQPVSKLQVGAFYDGARVTSADLVPYGEAATYDLLPDSASGAYWADGILLGSTLSASSIGQ